MERFFSILLILAMLCVPAFAEEKEDIPEDEGEEITAEEMQFLNIPGKDGTAVSGIDELYCMADTEEDALIVAECYGITLVRFDGVIAYFQNSSGIPTDELIARGMENGWVPIALNRTITLWDETPGRVQRKPHNVPDVTNDAGLPALP